MKQALNIKVPVYRFYTRETLEMTLVRTTKTMLVLQGPDNVEVRLNRENGTDGLSRLKRCYCIEKEAFEALKAQL